MAMMPPDDANPFRAPAATIGGPSYEGVANDAELIRRTYLSHEHSVKALGSLNYLGAFACVLGSIFFGLAAFGVVDMSNNNANLDVNPQVLMGVFAGVALLGLVIYGGLGYGLQHLQPWARWVTIALMALSLLSSAVQVVIAAAVNPVLAVGAAIGAAIGSLIPGFILYLMASSKGAMVFSREYREIIRATPHVKYKTSLIVKILLGVLVGVVLLAIIGGIIASFSAR